MNIIEYSRYGAAGGDIGSGVMEQLPRGGHFAPFVEPERDLQLWLYQCQCSFITGNPRPMAARGLRPQIASIPSSSGPGRGACVPSQPPSRQYRR